MKRRSGISVFIALALAGAVPAVAEMRVHDAHEHGVGSLSIAIEGDRMGMTLEAPGMDIVGFEHDAETAEDLARIDAAVALLAEPLALFVMPDAAGCEATEISASLVGAKHEEESHGEGEQHTSFRAEYLLACTDIESVDGIDITYFAAFPNARSLVVQVISETGAHRVVVESAAPRLDLGGVIRP